MLSTPTASAYNLTGAHLPNPRFTGRISQTYNGSGAAWGTGISAWNGTLTPILISKPISPTPLSPTLPITLYDANFSDVSWDGIANWSPANGTIQGTSARLNYYYTNNYETNKKKGIAAHELGHLIGLTHIDACYLMAQMLFTNRKSLRHLLVGSSGLLLTLDAVTSCTTPRENMTSSPPAHVTTPAKIPKHPAPHTQPPS